MRKILMIMILMAAGFAASAYTKVDSRNYYVSFSGQTFAVQAYSMKESDIMEIFQIRQVRENTALCQDIKNLMKNENKQVVLRGDYAHVYLKSLNIYMSFKRN